MRLVWSPTMAPTWRPATSISAATPSGQPRAEVPRRVRAPRLVLRSSKAVHEDPWLVAWGRWWAAPHPRPGTGIELAGRHPGGQGDLLRGGKRLAGKGFAAKQPPPALLQIQPAGPLGDEGVLDAGVAGQPGAGRDA